MAHKKSIDKIETPLSALIDVVFLLLMYFISSQQPEIPEAHVAINLPSPSAISNPQQAPPQLLEIHVLPNFQYSIQNTPMSLDAVGTYLQRVGALNSKDTTVIIKVAPDATEGNLVSVLDRCNKANLSQLNVMMMQ